MKDIYKEKPSIVLHFYSREKSFGTCDLNFASLPKIGNDVDMRTGQLALFSV